MRERVRSLESLAGEIRSRPCSGPVRLVAVDGRSGAGKSTLARPLAAAQRRPLWIEWMALEEEFFSRDGAPGRADYIVSGQPHRDHDPANEMVVLDRR